MAAIDNEALGRADEHARNAEWFMRTREADRENKANRAKMAFFLAGTTGISTWPCPVAATKVADGCAAANGTWSYTNAPQSWDAGGALKGNQTWYGGFTRPPWNVPGADYKVGATDSIATMLANPSTYDPAVRAWPAGCTYSASGWPWNTSMAWVNCINSSGSGGKMSFNNLYLGAAFGHPAVALEMSRLVNNEITNVISYNDANVSNPIFSGGFRIGQFYLPSSTVNTTWTNVSFLGNFNDGTGCCDTATKDGQLLLLNSAGTHTFDYVVFKDWVISTVDILSSNDTGPRATLNVKHSVVDGCNFRSAVGHTECWVGGRGWAQMNWQYNLFAQPYNAGNHRAFFHMTSTASPAGVGGLDYENNVVLLKQNSTLNGSLLSGVPFSLVGGTFTLTGAIANPYDVLQCGVAVNSAIDPVLGGTKNTQLSLYKQNGSNAFGPTFQTDCAGDQLVSTWCPVTGVYGNTTTVAATTGGQISSLAANYVHDWGYTPMTGTVVVQNNYIDPSSLGTGFMESPSDCSGITSFTWTNNINLLDGTSITGWAAPLGTSC